MINSKAADTLQQDIVKLIFEEPYFANLLLNLNREFSTNLPTLGVSVTDHVNLLINPHFYLSLPQKERVALLCHELYHVINNHFVRFRDLEPQIFDEKERGFKEILKSMKSASTLNNAADYAINEYIPNLPKNFNIFDKNGEKLKDKFGKIIEANPLLVKDLKKTIPEIKNQHTLEYYYSFLKKDEKNNGEGEGEGEGENGEGKGQKNEEGNNGMVLDDHSLWHESDLSEEEITQKVKEVVNKALEQTRDCGNISGNILTAIEHLNHVPRDWRQDIQRFVARSAEILIEPSRKKRNRRYGTIFPGHRTFPKLTIAVAVDTSASVKDEELTQFFTEVLRLHKMDIKIFIIECDTEAKPAYDYDPKKKIEITGRGGTSFVPAFEEAKKLDPDGLIYFTDGENFDGDNLKKPKFPVLWALLPDCKSHYNWGAKTKIEVKKRVRV